MTDNNIPAFPCAAVGRTANDEHYEISQTGMTLRDWFAGMALQGLLSGMASHDECEIIMGEMAEKCFEQADAMMKARDE